MTIRDTKAREVYDPKVRLLSSRGEVVCVFEDVRKLPKVGEEGVLARMDLVRVGLDTAKGFLAGKKTLVKAVQPNVMPEAVTPVKAAMVVEPKATPKVLREPVKDWTGSVATKVVIAVERRKLVVAATVVPSSKPLMVVDDMNF